jgi:glucose/arabinose dehydrogenase
MGPRVWRRGAAALVALALGVAAAWALAGAAHARTRPKPRTTTVRVAATEFRFALSRASAPAGTVRFVVTNTGRVAHNFFVAGRVTPLLQPGRTATLTVRFAKAGSYRYLCTVPGHAAAGMLGRFRIGKAPAPKPKPATTTTAPTATTPAPQPLALTALASGFGVVTDVEVAPGDADRIFVLQQNGRIAMLAGGAQTQVADFGPSIRNSGESGLLGLAWSPDFATDRVAYVYYNDRVENGRDTVAAVKVRSDWTFDLSTLKTILVVRTFGANHRGGDLAFGPDGSLYVPVGDSDNGTYTTPGQYAQDATSMLGGIVRIRPTPYGSGAPYTLPGNAAIPGGAPAEMWAKGLRNPWRDYLDAKTGLYYIGDVGADDREEFDVVPLDAGGRNFGWPCWEGTLEHAASPVSCPDRAQLTFPALEYGHDKGCAVIAGVVVHDPRLPALAGSFLYADDCLGDLRAFDYANGAAANDRSLGVHVDGNPDTFAEGPDGRVYVGTIEGAVYRLDPAG